MREYLIKGKGGVTWGTLSYTDGIFKISFRKDIDIIKDKPPMFVSEFIRNGTYDLTPSQAKEWIQYRIVPPDRQNIAEILKANHLKFYREIDVLELNMGRCSFDDIYLEKIN